MLHSRREGQSQSKIGSQGFDIWKIWSPDFDIWKSWSPDFDIWKSWRPDFDISNVFWSLPVSAHSMQDLFCLLAKTSSICKTAASAAEEKLRRSSSNYLIFNNARTTMTIKSTQKIKKQPFDKKELEDKDEDDEE